MDEECRSATINDFKQLITSLNEKGAEYFLIGGYALFAHGYHRATTDIDILVPSTPDAGRRIIDALMVLPEQVARDIDVDWFTEGQNIRVADEFIVDVMLNACGETYESLKQYAETVEIDGLQIKTVSLEGLLKTKQTSRSKDIMDRVILERAIDEIRRQNQQGTKKQKNRPS